MLRGLRNAIAWGTVVGCCIAGMLVSVDAVRAQSIGGNGGGGGGGLTQGVADTLYCALAGCTMTGTINGTAVSMSGAIAGAAVSGTTGTFSSTVSGTTITSSAGFVTSGVTTDVTTTGNEDLVVQAAGTGRTRIGTGDNVILMRNAASATGFLLDMTSGASPTTHRLTSSGGALGFSSNGTGGVGIGSVSDNTATERSGCFSENMSSSSARTDLICAQGGGRLNFQTPQTCTCVANAGAGGTLGGVTCDPTSGVVLISNPDTDGCIVTLSETSATTAGAAKTTFAVTVNAGGVVTFPDVAGVHAGPSCADTTGLGVGDTYETMYVVTTLAAYQGIGCGDN